MKAPRRTQLIFILVGTVGIAASYFVGRQYEENALPTLRLRAEETPSSEFLNAQRAVEHYRDEINRKPNVAQNYTDLALLFLQEARITGDYAQYIPKARLLIDQSLERNPDGIDALLARASMLMTMHQFSEARKIAEEVIAKNPYNAFAHGVLCDALVELGDYGNAVKACDTMLSIRPDLRSYSRCSYLREMHGDLIGARESMKLAADAGVWGQENRAWALYNLANLYLMNGKVDTAAYIYAGILEERPDYPFALSGLAQVARTEGKNDEAVALLSKAATILPEHLFYEQLADVYRAAGQQERAAEAARAVFVDLEKDEKNGWNIDNEYAAFCSRHELHLDEALRRARRNYELRPKNVQALDTYALALSMNGLTEDAVRYIDRALYLNTKQPMLLYHAGIICRKAGQSEKAQMYFNEMMTLNPFANVLYVDNLLEDGEEVSAFTARQNKL